MTHEIPLGRESWTRKDQWRGHACKAHADGAVFDRAEGIGNGGDIASFVLSNTYIWVKLNTIIRIIVLWTGG